MLASKVLINYEQNGSILCSHNNGKIWWDWNRMKDFQESHFYEIKKNWINGWSGVFWIWVKWQWQWNGTEDVFQFSCLKVIGMIKYVGVFASRLKEYWEKKRYGLTYCVDVQKSKKILSLDISCIFKIKQPSFSFEILE